MIDGSFFEEGLPCSSIPAMFNQAADHFGDRLCQGYQPDPARPAKTGFFSYKAVLTKVKDLGAGLLSYGIRPHDVLALAAGSSFPASLWINLAISACGAVTLSITPSVIANHLPEIIKKTKCRMIFIQDQELIPLLLGCLDEMPFLEKVIIVSEHIPLPVDRKFISLAQLAETGRRFLTDHLHTYKSSCAAIRPEDPALIIYSSAPAKPMTAHTHGSILRDINTDLLRFALAGFPIDEHDILLSLYPQADPKEIWGQLQTIFTGGMIAYPQQAATFIRDIQVYDPSWIQTSPKFLEKVYGAMQDAYSSIPEGKALFDISIETGLAALAYQPYKNGFSGMNTRYQFREYLPGETRELYDWAYESVFSKFRLLFGHRFRFCTAMPEPLSEDLKRIYLSMGITIL